MDLPDSVLTDTPRAIRATKSYDLAVATPLIALFVWYGVQNFNAIEATAGGFVRAPSLIGGLALANRMLLVAVLAMQVALFVLRPVASNRTHELAPKIAAIFAVAISMAYLFLPADPQPRLQLLSACIASVGFACSVLALACLGRSFSVMPEARRLVTHGPYRVVRHPLYAAELLANFGIMLQFRQPLSLLVFLAFLLSQIARMGYEERILEQTFPAYGEYRKRSWRLLPYVY